MVVEDNPINQKVASGLLQQLGCTVGIASNGLEALTLLERESFDLLLMDVQMPELDGLECTRRIRAAEQRAPGSPRKIIVALTTHAMTGDRERCEAAGMDDYLSKPVRPEVLRATLRKWQDHLQGGAPARSATAGPENPPPSEVPPVDLDRINEFASGDPAAARELVELYLNQTAQQLAEIAVAIQAQDAPKVGRIAHTAVGASATCGITLIVPTLRELERRGQGGHLPDSTPALHAQATTELERIRGFLEVYLQSLNG
jgi:CheY-like chemotaxis protein/HPt (histidine-containing phosphotransfer) domain-containing protein